MFEANLKDPKVKSLDSKSLYEVLCASDLSAEAIELLASTWTLETSLQFSILHFLRDEFLGIWAQDFDEIQGGNDLLPREFYKRLEGRIVQDGAVSKVEQFDDKVTVTFRASNGNTVSETADWFICTFPLAIVQGLEFSPPLSDSKERAIRRIHYDSATKVLAKVNRRFWELDDNVYGGGSISDELITSVWYPSDNQARDRGESNKEALLLASYNWGQNARRMDAIPNEELKGVICNQLSNLHPGLRTKNDVEDVYRWGWTNHQWSKGAYAAFFPNEHSDLYRELLMPEGKVILAGEHTSLTHGWMQGALESALRASQYIANVGS
jgi:monoamine oxidase